MNFGQAFKFLFNSPRWGMNLLQATVCILIPIIGPIVLMGYSFSVKRALILDHAASPPDFDFNKFSQYLSRGVYPFVASLLASLMVVPFICLMYVPMFIGMAMADKGPFWPIAGMCCGFLLYIPLILVFSLIGLPILLRATLLQDIGGAFKFDWIKDFITRMWAQILLAQIVLILAGILLAPIGVCALFVGIYAVITYLMFVQWHIHSQLYLLYLDRGGIPLLIKDYGPDAPTYGFPVNPPPTNPPQQ